MNGMMYSDTVGSPNLEGFAQAGGHRGGVVYSIKKVVWTFLLVSDGSMEFSRNF